MLLPAFLFVIWISLLLILKKLKMQFFVFILGSVGLFGFSMYAGVAKLEKYLEYVVAYTLNYVGKSTGIFAAHPEYSTITVYYRQQAISFFVDYECSGIIETLVYICLLLFYPVYSVIIKIAYLLAGALYILAANIVRVFLICAIAKGWGPSSFFLSHTVAGRILFFILMVVLYYRVFTYTHIKRQKVGGEENGAR